jgi:hypothetical protein
MRPYVVVVVAEAIEGALLGAERRGAEHDLALERQMKPFVLSVLLRLAGLDALMADAEPMPPGRQLRKPARPMHGGKRRPVVAADGRWQPKGLKRPLERAAHAAAPRVGQRRARQQVAAVGIGDGEGIATAPADDEVAFEIDAPERVRRLRPAQRSLCRRDPTTPAPRHHQTIAMKNERDRADRW